jgi:hypothetical protein
MPNEFQPGSASTKRNERIAAGIVGLLVIGLIANWGLGPKDPSSESSETAPTTAAASASATHPQTARSVAIPAQAAPTAAIPATTRKSSGEWRVSNEKSEMDGSAKVGLFLDANNEVDGWLKTQRPKLVIRCQEHKTDLYVNTGMPANPEYGSFNEYTVRLRLDQKPPTRQSWGQSTNNESLFAPSAIQLAKQLATAETLIFEFTPFNSSPARAEFNVSGLNEHLKEVAQACGWNSAGKVADVQ